MGRTEAWVRSSRGPHPENTTAPAGLGRRSSRRRQRSQRLASSVAIACSLLDLQPSGADALTCSILQRREFSEENTGPNRSVMAVEEDGDEEEKGRIKKLKVTGAYQHD